MPVLGIDLGTSTVVTGAAQKRGVDIVLNETANRRNPTCITFTACERNVGEMAQITSSSNIHNHITNIVRFIGRSYDAADVQEELKEVSFSHKRLPNGEIGVVVKGYDGTEETVFTFVQLLAMVFHKIQEDVVAFLGFDVKDVVIAVPSWFTQIQKKAIQAAASIVDFSLLAIISTHLAAVIAYGIRKLPELEDNSKDPIPLKTLFLDVGESTTTAALTGFGKGKFQVLSFATDRNLGGRNFDKVLFNLVASDIEKKHHLDIRTNRRASQRLMKALRQTKHVLSSNTEATYGIECLMNDIDVNGKITREEYDGLISGLCDKVVNVVKKCLENAAELNVSFSSIEIYGGGTRTPLLQRKVLDYLNTVRAAAKLEPLSSVSKMLNADECVAYGTTMYGAFNSKGFKTPDIEVFDTPLYNIALANLALDDTAAAKEDVTLIFTKRTKIPALLQTHYKKYIDEANPKQNKLVLQLRYVKSEMNFSEEVNGNESIFNHEPTTISDVVVDLSAIKLLPQTRETSEGNVRVRVKVRCDNEGLYSISSVRYEEEYETTVKEKVPRERKEEDPEEMKSEKENPEEIKEKAKEPKEPEFDIVEKVVLKKRWTPLPIKTTEVGVKAADTQFYREQEMKMRLLDVKIKQLKEKRNELETLIYSTRDAISYKLASTIPDSSALNDVLNKAEMWLYDQASQEANVADFDHQLKAIHTILDPYEKIYAAHIALDEASSVVDRLDTDDALKLLDSEDAKYAHIDKKRRQAVKDKATQTKADLQEKLSGRYSFDPTKMPPITLGSVKQSVDAVIAEARKLMAEPKPAPKKEEKKEEKGKEEKKADPEAMDAQKSPSASDLD